MKPFSNWLCLIFYTVGMGLLVPTALIEQQSYIAALIVFVACVILGEPLLFPDCKAKNLRLILTTLEFMRASEGIYESSSYEAAKKYSAAFDKLKDELWKHLKDAKDAGGI